MNMNRRLMAALAAFALTAVSATAQLPQNGTPLKITDIRVNGTTADLDWTPGPPPVSGSGPEVKLYSSTNLTDWAEVTNNITKGVGWATVHTGAEPRQFFRLYEVPPATVIVTFNGNGGSTPSPITAIIGGTYGTLPVPTWTGYDFNGWFTAKSGGSQVTASSTVPSSNHTLWAQWQFAPLDVEYYIPSWSGPRTINMLPSVAAIGLAKINNYIPGQDSVSVLNGTFPIAADGTTAPLQILLNGLLVQLSSKAADPYPKWIPGRYQFTLRFKRGTFTKDLSFDLTLTAN